MTSALEHVRNNCGMAGEEVADMVDALESEIAQLKQQHMIASFGDPAFPSPPVIGSNGDLLRPVDIGCQGMTLRDYFAAKALPSLLIEDGTSHCYFKDRARESYEIADAMIRARSKT